MLPGSSSSSADPSSTCMMEILLVEIKHYVVNIELVRVRSAHRHQRGATSHRIELLTREASPLPIDFSMFRQLHRAT
uniref:Uncharacterized protein n=1 Tax=Arundo donax TaxID=35708 RepID=A0A0A9H4D9_ARUDO